MELRFGPQQTLHAALAIHDDATRLFTEENKALTREFYLKF
jgi:hypothetical protein